MNKGLYFFLGAGIGSALTYIFLNGRFKEKEKELYAREYEERKKRGVPKEEEPTIYVDEKEKELMPENPDLMEYAKMLSEKRYNQKSDTIEKDRPYIISWEEKENNEEYEKVALVYYSDGILAYEAGGDEIFENAAELIGDEFKDKFKDGEVFVRNDVEKTDYEIYIDERTYEEVSGNKAPHSGSEE